MKKQAFTLIEMLVAMTLLSIFMIFIYQFTHSVQLGEKRLRISKDFQGESRLILDKLTTAVRNNTIDYDRYFIEIGPNPNNLISPYCQFFDNKQIIAMGDTPASLSNERCNSQKTLPDVQQNKCHNDKDERETLSYPEIFYWDTTGDKIPDRQLGGMNLAGSDPDPCSQAFHKTTINDHSSDISVGDKLNGENPHLFLINNTKNTRYAFRLKESADFCNNNGTTDNCRRLMLQTQLGADTDNDGLADLWAPNGSATVTWNNSQCLVDGNLALDTNINSEADCLSVAHDWTAISLESVDIKDLNFDITPTRDPYLAFRILEAQKQPRVKINLNTRLKDPKKFGFEPIDRPTLNLQTTISSRIYGNNR